MNDETGTGGMRESSPATPRWVKAFGVVVLVVALLFVVLKFAGGGRHGPSRHMQRGDTSQQSDHR